MKIKSDQKDDWQPDEPLLYHKTREEIEAYRKKPVLDKLKWLEAQMEFNYLAMPEKAKKVRERLKNREL